MIRAVDGLWIIKYDVFMNMFSRQGSVAELTSQQILDRFEKLSVSPEIQMQRVSTPSTDEIMEMMRDARIADAKAANWHHKVGLSAVGVGLALAFSAPVLGWVGTGAMLAAAGASLVTISVGGLYWREPEDVEAAGRQGFGARSEAAQIHHAARRARQKQESEEAEAQALVKEMTGVDIDAAALLRGVEQGRISLDMQGLGHVIRSAIERSFKTELASISDPDRKALVQVQYDDFRERTRAPFDPEDYVDHRGSLERQLDEVHAQIEKDRAAGKPVPIVTDRPLVP